MSAGGAGPDVRVLSPHLDDAVLSCGGAIAGWSAAGRAVEVFTPFAADEPDPLPPSPLVEMLHRAFGLGSGIVAARREEDREAVELLGARARWGSFLEAVYRTDPRGAPVHADLGSLFRPPLPADAPVEGELAERFLELEPAGRWLAPLGVGGHVDHLLVRRAAERAAREAGWRLAYYEDVPYVLRWRALARVLRDRKRSWREDFVPVASEALELKVAATAAYRSQVRPLFGGERAMAAKLRRLHRRRGGGERLWRRVGDPAGPEPRPPF